MTHLLTYLLFDNCDNYKERERQSRLTLRSSDPCERQQTSLRQLGSEILSVPDLRTHTKKHSVSHP